MWLLGLVAVALALAGAPMVQAADGSGAGGTDVAQTQAATAPETTSGTAAQSAAGAADTSGSSGAPAAGAEPPATTTETPVHAADGPASPDAGADTNVAPPTDSVAAQGSEPASDVSPAGGTAEQETSVAQTAAADATATQEGVGNTTVTVRVDQPGDGSPVSQENRAEGNAEATAAADTSVPVTSDQEATATAEGTQTDVQNTAVSVRVGSPGDNAAVEQANAAVATASTSVVPPQNGQGTVDESAVAAAAQDGASNTSVSIRVFSPGNDGAVNQSNQAVAAADTSSPDGASAAATQSGVQNTNVSVRVESDGVSGAVTQQSAASATAAGAGVAVTTTRDGLDTNLSVVVDGDGLARPGPNGLQIWEWTWNWSRDESVDAPLDTQPSSWNWAWGSAGGPAGPLPGQVTTRSASADDHAAGSWTWNWDWTRDGAPNWTWQWSSAAQLPCGSCIWIWNWTWSWTGQPAQTGSAAAGDESSNNRGTPDQANVTIASAEATVTADVAQAITQDGEGAGEQYAGQLVSVEQVADAVAAAAQSDVDTVATANLLTPQVNRVTSRSTVTVGADLAQQAEQTMRFDGEGDATQWSGQEIDVVQHARANVRSAQSGVSLRTGGTFAADSQASSTTVAELDQRVAQDALVDGGTTDQWAGQLALAEQTSDAVSNVQQTGAAAPHFVEGIARAQSTSGALARVDQNLAQSAARGGGLGSQTAMQIVYVGQEGSTIATTTQRAGSAPGPATSEARATDRALVVQDGVQESTGALALDIQDLTQQSIVVQVAIATSTSAGGIAGSAVVGNCVIVQQTAGQSLAGGPAAPAGGDLSAFCASPSAAAAAGRAAVAAFGFSAPTATLAVEPAAAGALPPDVLDVQLFHDHRLQDHRRLSAAARGPRAITPRFPLVRSEPASERRPPGSPAMTQISVPRPTQARFDTRPEGYAGDGDAGTEPPLPPAGDPPAWASALAAAAAAGGGPAGIAAILAAFVLVPPLLRRAQEGSAVRRPIDVLSRVDVPV